MSEARSSISNPFSSSQWLVGPWRMEVCSMWCGRAALLFLWPGGYNLSPAPPEAQSHSSSVAVPTSLWPSWCGMKFTGNGAQNQEALSRIGCLRCGCRERNSQVMLRALGSPPAVHWLDLMLRRYDSVVLKPSMLGTVKVTPMRSGDPH